MKKFIVFVTYDGEIGALELYEYWRLSVNIRERVAKIIGIDAFSAMGALINAPENIYTSAATHHRLTFGKHSPRRGRYVR